MYRSKKLLKAVSELSCQHCGVEGMTQAAHANWGVYGKGMGQKAHDCFVAALCIRCHAELDQGKNLTALNWQTQTTTILLLAGMPKPNYVRKTHEH